METISILARGGVSQKTQLPPQLRYPLTRLSFGEQIEMGWFPHILTKTWDLKIGLQAPGFFFLTKTHITFLSSLRAKRNRHLWVGGGTGPRPALSGCPCRKDAERSALMRASLAQWTMLDLILAFQYVNSVCSTSVVCSPSVDGIPCTNSH